MVCMIIPGTACVTVAEPAGVTEIDTAEELLAINGVAGNYKLTEDIDLGDTTYNAAPIALADGTVLDGDGHSITGFALKEGSTTDLSLFSISTGTVTVKGLTFGASQKKIAVSANKWGISSAVVVSQVPTGATLNVENVDVYVNYTRNDNNSARKSGFVGTSLGTLNLTDCTVSGYIGGGAESGTYGTSAFVGVTQNSNVTIKNCVNHAEISGKDNVGGIIGNWQGGDLTIETTANNGKVLGTKNVGGCIGNTWSGNAIDTDVLTLDGFTNNGAVSSPGGVASGVIGYLHVGSRTGGTVTIQNSVQNGSVNGKIVGGYIAQSNWKYSITVNECVNHDMLTATGVGSHAGGVVGDVTATVGSITITDFLNTAKITSESASAAGVAHAETGDNQGLTVSAQRLVNLGDIYGKWNVGTVTGYTKNATLIIRDCICSASLTTSDNKADAFAKYAADVASVTAENNFYVIATKLNNTGAEQKKAQDVLAVLTTVENGYKFGPYKLNDAKNRIIVILPPVLKGCQIGAEKDGMKSLRLVAVLNELDYKEVGFRISVNGGENETVKRTSVFTALKAKNEDGSIAEYTAQSLGGSYVYALSVDVPAEGTQVITAVPYSIGTDGTVYTGIGYMVTLIDGVFAEAVAAV